MPVGVLLPLVCTEYRTNYFEKKNAVCFPNVEKVVTGKEKNIASQLQEEINKLNASIMGELQKSQQKARISLDHLNIS